VFEKDRLLDIVMHDISPSKNGLHSIPFFNSLYYIYLSYICRLIFYIKYSSGSSVKRNIHNMKLLPTETL
jgi:hypothetical protein